MFDKRLLSLIPEARKPIAASVALSWVALAANIALFFLIGSFLQKLLAGQAGVDAAMLMCAQGALAIAVRMVCQTQAQVMGRKAAAAAKLAIRSAVYDKLVALGPAYHETVPTSEAVQICVEGTEQLESYFGSYMPQLFYALAAPVTLFCCLAPVNLPAALVLLACVPLIPVSIMAVQKIAKRTMRTYWGSYTDLGAMFLESLQGLTTLKIYRADEERQRIMDAEAESFRKATMNLLKMQLNSITIMDLFAFGGAAAAIVVLLAQFQTGAVSFAGAFAFIFLSAEFFIPLRTLGSFFHTAANGMAAAEKMYAVLDAPDEAQGTRELSGRDITVEARGLKYVYGDGRVALKGVDFAAEAGAFTGIAGESGSGKSTLAGVLAGRCARYGGSVLIGGVEARELSRASLRRCVTYVGHAGYLFKGTIRENLLLARPDADDQALHDALEAARLDAFVREAGGLDAHVAAGGTNLSGGQRQRLVMARALLADTPVYIFDEATSNIDAESESAIIALIEQISRDHTVIMISHRLRALRQANAIYVLADGSLACTGTHEELAQGENPYARMWAKQSALEARIDAGGQADCAPEEKPVVCAAARDDQMRTQGASGGRGGLGVMRRLSALVSPLAPVMALAVVLGVAGFLFAIFLTVFAVYGLLSLAGLSSPLSAGTACALVIGCGVLRGPARYGEQMCNHYLAFRILALVRERVFAALRRLAPAKLDGRDKGDLVSAITSDIELLEVFYAHTLSPIVIAVITSGIMVAFIASQSLAMGALALAAYLLVGAVVPLVAARVIGSAGRAMRREIGEMNTYVLDSLEGLAETLQFGGETARAQGLASVIRRHAAAEDAAKRKGALFMALTGAAVMAADIAALALGAHLVAHGHAAFEPIALATAALMSSFGPVIATANLGSTLQQTIASGERVIDILDEKPQVEEVAGSMAAKPFANLNIRDVHFSYEGTKILRGVSLDVARGEVVRVTGRSGAGKSTLLKLVMRFWDPDLGSIALSGDDLRDIDTESLRENEGFMTQETHLFTGTIRENLLLARADATDAELREALSRAALASFVDALPDGLDTRIGEFGGGLSGGERQRIGLARVFLHDAPLILLDEPTSNLDALSEAIVFDSIARNLEGKTILLVSHRATADAICSRSYSVEGTRAS